MLISTLAVNILHGLLVFLVSTIQPIASSTESLHRTKSGVSISSITSVIASSARSLYRTDSRASINSITSFVKSINTKKAFRTDLYMEMGLRRK